MLVYKTLFEGIFIVTLIGVIFFIMTRPFVIRWEKPKFKRGNIFWNYFRLFFSTEYCIPKSKLELKLKPKKIHCNACNKDYTKIFETYVTSGNLNFLGNWEWAKYERIQCFCGQTLNFVIDPNK